MTTPISGPVATLRTRWLGFDKEEVRSCLQNLIGDYEEAYRQIQRLTADLEAARAKTTALPARQEPAGVQVERVLASAHRIAEEVKADAQRAARELLREAQDEAAQLRRSAEADSAALTRTAATRLAELEAEIQEMTDRRHVVQAMLDRAADRMAEIAQDLRQAAVPRPAGTEETALHRITAII